MCRESGMVVANVNADECLLRRGGSFRMLHCIVSGVLSIINELDNKHELN